MAHQQDMLNGSSAGIPLHCNVCPKKPDFSDVSHLLTHIASKGHLSNYYKLKIKATSDRAAERVTNEYDRWYEEYSVQELMGERMKQKEKRKGSNGGGNAGHPRRAAGVASTARNTPMNLPTYADHRRQGLRESTLDPQLGFGPRIKIEPDSRPGTPMSALSVDPAALSRSFMPPMLQSWPTTPYGNTPTTQEPSIFDSLDTSPSSEWVESEAPRRGRRRTARNLSDSKCSVFDDDEEEDEDELQYDDGHGDNTKLKGVYWDGMGIFDSATPDMRRKRNQKKAYSVIQSLMATSELVDATEMVFDADIELHRERDITGNPNEEDGMSPLKGEESPEVSSPPPKKKIVAKRPRQALAQKNVNTGRVLRRRDSHHPGFKKEFARGPYYDGPDDEDEMTYGAPRPRKRSGLSIHRDNSGPEITFDNPASMNTLTSGFRPRHSGGSRDQSMYQSGRSSFSNNYTHQRLPSLSGNGNNGFRPAHTPQLGSFGQFTGQPMFQNNHFNPYALMAGTAGLAAFQQHMGGLGMGQQSNAMNPFGHDGMFHVQTQNFVQPQNA